MATTLTVNQKFGTAVVRKTGSGSDTILLADLENAGETVHSFTVAEIQWGVASGTVTLNRGANSGIFNGGTTWGHFKFNDTQMRIEAGGDAAADLDIVTSGAGTVLVKLHKKASSNTA